MTAVAGGGSKKLVPISPDGGWGWVVVIGSFFVHVFADGFVYSFGVMVEKLMEEFKSDNTTCSLIISLLTGLTLGSGPIASAVCNKFGCRVTTIMGACIAAVGCTASYMATAMWQIVFSVGIVMGVGFGLMYCPAIVIVTMYFERWRSLATGIAVAGAGVGTVLFSPVNAYLIDNHGWRSVFLVFLGVLVLCALCGATFRPLKFREVDEEEEGETKEKTTSADAKNPEVKLSEQAGLLNVEQKPKLSKSLSDIGEGGEEAAARQRKRCNTDASEKETGFINRADVFYTGSITNVAEFKENPDKYRSTGSLHKKGKSLEALPNSVEDDDNTDGSNMLQTIARFFSFSLMQDPCFLLFAISNLLTSVGFNSPLYFLPLHATKIGLDNVLGAKVLSVFGLCNTVGRIVFGVVADHKLPFPYGIGNDPVRNRLWMYNISLAICGVLTVFCFAFDGFIPLCVYSGLFGFSIASYICLTSVILVDLLGLDKLTNAFGLLLLWQGVGTVFGPPISGILADLTGTYTWSFVFCGINLLISGLMLFAIPHYQAKARAAASAKNNAVAE